MTLGYVSRQVLLGCDASSYRFHIGGPR